MAVEMLTLGRAWTYAPRCAAVLPQLAVVLLAPVLALRASAAAADARPNIVLLIADDQGGGETGYNGHPQVKTPVLDEMARTALRLDRFYAGSRVCSPTHASVMTGRHANRSGAFAPNGSTRPEEITLAHILKAAGYRTGHFGKWHLDKWQRVYAAVITDGVITLPEYLAAQKGSNLEQRFKNFDRNGDGKLSREEFVTPGAK